MYISGEISNVSLSYLFESQRASGSCEWEQRLWEVSHQWEAMYDSESSLACTATNICRHAKEAGKMVLMWANQRFLSDIDFKPQGSWCLPLLSSELSIKTSTYLIFMGQPVSEGSDIDLFNRSTLKWGTGRTRGPSHYRFSGRTGLT